MKILGQGAHLWEPPILGRPLSKGGQLAYNIFFFVNLYIGLANKIQIKPVMSYVKSDLEDNLQQYSHYKCLLGCTPINLIIIDHQILHSIYPSAIGARQ